MNLLPVLRLSARLFFVMTPLAPDTPNPQTPDPDQWVDRYGDCLYHLAIERLHDSSDAQYLVQETFWAAWQSRETFSPRSSESAWLIGILRHKILDKLRAHYRQNPVTDVSAEEKAIQDFFEPAGHPKKSPSAWVPASEALLPDEKFWEVMRKCARKLPPSAHDAFLLREVDHLDSQTICEVLNITQTHLWVLLHRARLQIRQCLEINWFESKRDASCS